MIVAEKTSGLLCALPRRISLWDMEIYLARRLVNVSEWLCSCRLATMHPSVLGESDNARIMNFLKLVAAEADNVRLTQTAIMSRRVLSEYTGQKTADMFDRINQLADLFSQESESIQFFTLKPERLRFYNNPELAGSKFKAGFPRANFELTEAGNCVAFDRYTGCICHLMRAFDIVLASLEQSMGITPPIKGAERTWGKTLERIGQQITNNKITPPPNWNDDREFYEQCRAFFQAIKGPYRDATFHVSAQYDEESATQIFSLATASLGHIAKKVVE